MGFIRAGLNAVGNSFNDALALEFYALPDNIEANVVAVLADQVKTNPNGTVTRSRKETGKISNGSKVIVPQGWVALMVNNGTFFADLAEPGEHFWDDGTVDSFFSKDAKLKEKLSGIWANIKQNFSYGGQEIAHQRIIYIKTQPLTNNLFGTSSPVEYFSERYQQTMNVTFHGFFDMRITDPVLFYAQVVSSNFEDNLFLVEQIANGSLKKTITPKLGVSLSKFVKDNQCEMSELNAFMDDFSLVSSNIVTQSWTQLYGISVIQIQLEDISWDKQSKEIADKVDDQLRYMKYGFAQVERDRAQNEALLNMAKNEGANGMMFGMGMMNGFNQMGSGMFQTTQQSTPNFQPQIVEQPTGFVNEQGQFIQTGTVKGYFDANGQFIKLQ